MWGAKNAGFKAILFSSEEGKDRIAEADPASLVAQSRKLGTLEREHIAPDKTITRLNMLIRAVKEMEMEI